jgi:hypothetical protein
MPFNENFFLEKLQKLERLIERVPMIVGQESENFFKDRFLEQGWRDGNLQRWQPKKRPNGYPVLRSKHQHGLSDTIM